MRVVPRLLSVRALGVFVDPHTCGKYEGSTQLIVCVCVFRVFVDPHTSGHIWASPSHTWVLPHYP